MRAHPFLILTGMIGAVMLCGVPAAADTIYDNGVTLDEVSGRIYSDFDFPQQVADSFILTQGMATITDIHWWGSYGTIVPEIDDFTIRIFANDSNRPAVDPFIELTPDAVLREATGLDLGGGPSFFYSLYVSPIVLAPDTTYWLSIVNDTSVAGASSAWGWLFDDSTGGAAWRDEEGDSWNLYTGECAFYLTNDEIIPEPATMALFGLGLAGIVGRCLRRRQA